MQGWLSFATPNFGAGQGQPRPGNNKRACALCESTTGQSENIARVVLKEKRRKRKKSPEQCVAAHRQLWSAHPQAYCEQAEDAKQTRKRAPKTHTDTDIDTHTLFSGSCKHTQLALSHTHSNKAQRCQAHAGPYTHGQEEAVQRDSKTETERQRGIAGRFTVTTLRTFEAPPFAGR